MKNKEINKAANNYVLNRCKDSVYTESTICGAFKQGAYLSNKYWRNKNQWKDISSCPEETALIFKFTENVEKKYCRLGYVFYGFVLLDRGDSISIDEAIFYGVKWKEIEVNETD